MTVNYTPIIKELAENKNKTGSFQKVGPDSLVGIMRIGYDWELASGLSLGVSYDMQETSFSNDLQEGDKVKIGDEVYLITHSSGMDKKVKIESKPKKYEVDNNFLKKSQSGNIEEKLADIATDPARALAQRADNDLVGGNVIANVFGVLGFAEQVINFLNHSQRYRNLELRTLDVNYLLKSMIEQTLPINSSLDLEDEYVKQIFEKSNVEKLTLILEFFLRHLAHGQGTSVLSNLEEIMSIIIKNCERKSVDCNIADFLPSNYNYGIVSDDMKKILKVVEAGQKEDGGSNDEGGGSEW